MGARNQVGIVPARQTTWVGGIDSFESKFKNTAPGCPLQVEVGDGRGGGRGGGRGAGEGA
jgi:hypothetical protein